MFMNECFIYICIYRILQQNILYYVIYYYIIIIIIVNLIDSCYNHQFHVTCLFLFYVIITNTMAYWYDGAALAATRSPVIALIWCLIKFTTTTTTTILTLHFLISVKHSIKCPIDFSYPNYITLSPLLKSSKSMTCMTPPRPKNSFSKMGFRAQQH